jgi:membrane-bound hydrogenase subunit beta
MDLFTSAFGDSVHEAYIRTWGEGVARKKTPCLWLRIDRALLHDAVERLMGITYPHLGVISGTDLGEAIELVYHFGIYYGTEGGEYMISFAASLPKGDPSIRTIADLIPGAVFSEREKQEMLGVQIVDIPDDRRLFLPEDFPEGVYPWRKDDSGIPDAMVKNLWEVGRPTDRPEPPVAEKEQGGETDGE